MWVSSLLIWFSNEKRAMPWRSNPSPYSTWISEMMLQQTQVATVIPYFERFITSFPTVNDLADADLQDVLKKWEGLGYYSRARNLHKAAQVIVNDYDGNIPSSYDNLQKLPGIGPYSAAAISSIAFEHPIPVVDGNVLRVFCRFWGIFDDIRKASVRTMLFDKLSHFISDVRPSDFNQGIMELGALVCTPKNPSCGTCPISTDCFAFKMKKQDQLPFKSPAPKSPHFNIAVAVIRKENRLLIGKRKEEKMLGGLWEFPGGKQEEQESLEETLCREVKEETDLTVSVGHAFKPIKHTYSHFKITLHAFECEVISGKEKANSAEELRWVKIEDIDKFPFPKANKSLIDQILKKSSPQT